MRRVALLAIGVLLLVLLMAPTASAHTAGPCDDSDGDGSPSGAEYAAHHIVPLATGGMLGAEPSGNAHVPGAHMGFSFCL